MHCTRPDISFVVGILSRFTSNPKHDHLNVAYRVLKYLKNTMYYRLHYKEYPTILKGTVMQTGLPSLMSQDPQVGGYLH